MAERILVVDDDPDAAAFAEFALKREGYEVKVASSGREALELVGIDRPDLILLDLKMPGLDGFAVLQTLKSSPTLWEIPVMVMSGNRSREDVTRAIRDGAADYLSKPYEPPWLVAKIQTVLRARQEAQDASPASIRSAPSVEAALRVRGVVEAVGENTVLFHARAQLEPGQVMELSMPSLESPGIDSPEVRILSRSAEPRGGEPGYLYRMELVGLSDGDKQRLRRQMLRPSASRGPASPKQPAPAETPIAPTAP